MAAAPTSYASSLIQSLRSGSSESKAADSPGLVMWNNYMPSGSGVTLNSAPIPTGSALAPPVLVMPPKRVQPVDTTNYGTEGDYSPVSVPFTEELDRFNPTVDYEEPLDPILDVPTDLLPDEVGGTPETGIISKQMDVQDEIDRLSREQNPPQETPEPTIDVNPPAEVAAPVEQVVIEAKRPTDEVVFEPNDQYVQLTLDETVPPAEDIPFQVAPEQPTEVPQVVVEAPKQSVPDAVLKPAQTPEIAVDDLFTPQAPEDVVIPELAPIQSDQIAPDDGLVDAVSVAEAVGIPAEVAAEVGITEATTVTAAPVEEPSYDQAMDVLYVPDIMLDMGGAGADSMDDFMMEDFL